MAKSGFGSIDKLPSGKWRVRYTNPITGETLKAPMTYATKGDANAYLATQFDALNKGTWRDTRHSTERLDTYALRLIEQSDNKPAAVPDRIRSYKNYIFPYLGDVAISDITSEHVRTWWTKLKADRPGKAETHAKSYRYLRAIMQTAVDCELINRNPCNIKGAGTNTRPKRTPLTIDEIASLAANVLPRYYALVWLLASTGLRIGEATALRIKDIDLDAKTLHVSRRVRKMPGGSLNYDKPKSAKGVRPVDIPAVVIPILQAHIDAYGQRESDALIFTTRNGVPAIEGGPVAIKKALVAIGKPDTRQHDLRATASALLQLTGATLTEIAQRNGQSNQMAEHYTSAYPEQQQRNAQKVSALFVDNVRYLPTPVPGDAVVNQ